MSQKPKASAISAKELLRTMLDALIIGAGIAGASIAHHLRGQNILILDANAVAGGASGNPKGMIKPWLSLGESPMRQFYAAAYRYAMELLDEFPDVVLQRGILQLPKAGELERFQDAPALAGWSDDDLRYLTAAETSDLMQTEIRSPAIFWPRAAVMDPAKWVSALLGEISIQNQSEVISIQNGQAALQSGEIIKADKIFIATGYAMHLLPEIAAQIRPRAGQITMARTAQLPVLPYAISFGHYWIPPKQGENHIIGATFEHHDQPQVTDLSHQKNIDAVFSIKNIIPALENYNLPVSECSGRSAVRATTANHLPLFGKADAGIYYLSGLGSRGLMSAPYAAKQLIRY